MARILQFPARDDQRLVSVQLSYSVAEISAQFGIAESVIRKWAKDGLVTAENENGHPRFGFQALSIFRRVRELKKKGLSRKDIESEFKGQLDLFSRGGGTLLDFPDRSGPFAQALRFFANRDPASRGLFERAVAQNDCPADAYCNLGILEYDQENIPAARQNFVLALSREPRHVESHHNLGVLYHNRAELKIARAHYEAALAIEPDFTHALFALGVLLAESGTYEPAVRNLASFLEIAEDTERRALAIDLLEKLMVMLRESGA